MVSSRDAQVDDLEGRVADACGVLNVANARLVELTAELIESDLWRGYGIRSVDHWLTLKTGLSPERARQVAEVAAATKAMPVTGQCFADGELSFEQVHAVAKHSGKFRDAEAASFAQVATVAQIRRTLSRYTFADPDTDVTVDADPGAGADAGAQEQEPGRRVAAAAAAGRLSQFNDGNRFSLHLDAPSDQGALIEAALNEAKDALSQAGKPDTTWFDALVEVCNRSLSAVEPSGRADKYRVYVHLDTEGGWLNAGPALPPGLLTKLTCNGSLAPVWETEGKPVNVGRTQRIVPNRTRRLVEDRDRGCRYPGCSARSYLEVHHVIHWRDGGPTDTWNLVCLCPHHHDAHHRGEFIVTGDADASEHLRFTDDRGNRISVGRPVRPTGVHLNRRQVTDTSTPSVNPSNTSGSTSRRRPRRHEPSSFEAAKLCPRLGGTTIAEERSEF